jgi:hypothetical protein
MQQLTLDVIGKIAFDDHNVVNDPAHQLLNLCRAFFGPPRVNFLRFCASACKARAHKHSSQLFYPNCECGFIASFDSTANTSRKIIFLVS